MSSNRLFGNFRPRLNVAPLLLTPGLAVIGYAIGGGYTAWCFVAAWLALIIGATVSCAIHTRRDVNDEQHAGRRAFDYDANNVGP